MSARAKAALGLALGSLLLGWALLGDHGPHIDSPKNWAEGEQNLRALLGEPVDAAVIDQQRHGALFLMAGAASRRLLGERLGPAAASHAPLVPLLAAFAALLFALAARRTSAEAALAGALCALTYPELFGLLLNSLKDAPLAAFSSLSLLAFASWRAERRPALLLGGYLALGLALCAKVYALFVPAVLLCWGLSLRRGADGAPPAPKGSWRYHAAGLLLVAALLAVFYVPGARGRGPLGVAEWLGGWAAWSRRTVVSPHPGGWGLYSFSQLMARAPLPLLAAAFAGAALALGRRPVRAWDRLLLLWLLLPLLPPCIPGLYAYQSGMRLFIVAAVPLALLAGAGAAEGGALLARRLRLPERPVIAALSALVLLPQAWGLIRTHPYQTAYFNGLAGGLGGAQARGVPYAYDHLVLSYQEAGRWLDAHAEPGAAVVAVQDAPWNWDLLRVSMKRRDLAVSYVDRVDALAASGPLPAGAYVLCIWDLLRGAPGYETVHAVERQGGRLLTVYRKSG
jgi:hypothetical protein